MTKIQHKGTARVDNGSKAHFRGIIDNHVRPLHGLRLSGETFVCEIDRDQQVIERGVLAKGEGARQALLQHRIGLEGAAGGAEPLLALLVRFVGHERG